MKTYDIDNGEYGVSAENPKDENVESQPENLIIDVPEEPVDDDRPTEIPRISIENRPDDKLHEVKINKIKKRRRARFIMRLFIGLLVALIIVGVLVAWVDSSSKEKKIRERVDNFIISLTATYEADGRGTQVTVDTVSGVALEIYPLSGLRASLERTVPDTTDKSLVIFMRSADYDKSGKVIGGAGIKGESIGEEGAEDRYGMVAISHAGQAMIDVLCGEEGDRVQNRLKEEEISFFRQYYLLSKGEPSDEFLLRGKVERAALVNDRDGRLYYITTRQRETLSDFSEALKEYGFSDAVYLPGGNAYTFWRDSSGFSHSNSLVEKKLEKYGEQPLPAPWLVFRRNDDFSAKSKM